MLNSAIADHHLSRHKQKIEFPTVLLPPNITSGSVVDIDVSRNLPEEDTRLKSYMELQNRIYDKFGVKSPTPPVLRLRNATQTSVVLEWDPIELATADLVSLSLYRNGAKAGVIPRPLEMLTTKISGLAIDTEYTFHLVLRTSAGTYRSQKLQCRTHKMTDLTGITVTFGALPDNIRESVTQAIERVGGKVLDDVRIDTTHFVCLAREGSAWEKAVKMNVPVIRPEWVDACEKQGTLVPVRGYYLDADPKARKMNPTVIQSRPQPQQQQRQQPQQQEQARRSGTVSSGDRPLPPTPSDGPLSATSPMSTDRTTSTSTQSDNNEKDTEDSDDDHDDNSDASKSASGSESEASSTASGKTETPPQSATSHIPEVKVHSPKPSVNGRPDENAATSHSPSASDDKKTSLANGAVNRDSPNGTGPNNKEADKPDNQKPLDSPYDSEEQTKESAEDVSPTTSPHPPEAKKKDADDPQKVDDNDKIDSDLHEVAL